MPEGGGGEVGGGEGVVKKKILLLYMCLALCLCIHCIVQCPCHGNGKETYSTATKLEKTKKYIYVLYIHRKGKKGGVDTQKGQKEGGDTQKR